MRIKLGNEYARRERQSNKMWKEMIWEEGTIKNIWEEKRREEKRREEKRREEKRREEKRREEKRREEKRREEKRREEKRRDVCLHLCENEMWIINQTVNIHYCLWSIPICHVGAHRKSWESPLVMWPCGGVDVCSSHKYQYSDET